MTDRIAAADPAALKKAFLGQRSALSPYIYLPLDTKGGLDREAQLPLGGAVVGGSYR